MKLLNRVFFSAALLAAVVCFAEGQEVAFDSYPAAAHGAWYVGDYAPNVQFESSKSGTLSGIVVDVFDNIVSGPRTFGVTLYADSAGSPGAQLGSWLGTTNGTNAVSIAAAGVALTGGSDYWLQVNYGAIGNASIYKNLAWAYSVAPNTLTVDPPGSYSSVMGHQAVYEVNVTPEPAPIAALGLGALGLMIRKRRNT